MNNPVAPCVLVPDDTPTPKAVRPDARLATVKGRSLAGFRVDEKTVGEVVPEIKKRGLKVTYLIMAVAPGNPGASGNCAYRTPPSATTGSSGRRRRSSRGRRRPPRG
ncbi:hypothetical protein ACFQX6_51680 [Streptosporangium lutulentum]